MGFGLGKLFGRQEPEAVRTPPAVVDDPVAGASAFLRSDAVFNRAGRIAGHLLRLHLPEAGLAEAPTRRQKPLDDALLRALCAAGEGAFNGRQPSFVPLCSASLDHPLLDRLPAHNTVLLLVLAPESTDGAALAARLTALGARGFRIGVFRQPRHPLFPATLAGASLAAVDVADSEGGSVRDFAAAMRGGVAPHPGDLFAANLETFDDYNLAHRCHFDYFHGAFFTAGGRIDQPRGDPHKAHLLRLMNLVQGEAETAEIAAALKQDPMLAFRILRYLNSPAIGLQREIASIDQALLVLGRQRLARWLSVLIFSVKNPDFADWLLVESALGRGRIMETLGAARFAPEAADALFLTGIFSTLDRLLRIPLAEAVAPLSLPDPVRAALLAGDGPYAPLLAVASACETFDPAVMSAAAARAGLDPAAVNAALIEATAWASEVTAHWE